MAGSWGCPHETDDLCSRVNDLPCDPGMKGCVLFGRYVFANEDKNERIRQREDRVPDSNGDRPVRKDVKSGAESS